MPQMTAERARELVANLISELLGDVSDEELEALTIAHNSLVAEITETARGPFAYQDSRGNTRH